MDGIKFSQLSIDSKLEVIYLQLIEQQAAIASLQTATAALTAAKDNLASRIAALENAVTSMGLTAAQELELLNAINTATGDVNVVTLALDQMAKPTP